MLKSAASVNSYYTVYIPVRGVDEKLRKLAMSLQAKCDEGYIYAYSIKQDDFGVAGCPLYSSSILPPLF